MCLLQNIRDLNKRILRQILEDWNTGKEKKTSYSTKSRPSCVSRFNAIVEATSFITEYNEKVARLVYKVLVPTWLPKANIKREDKIVLQHRLLFLLFKWCNLKTPSRYGITSSSFNLGIVAK